MAFVKARNIVAELLGEEHLVHARARAHSPVLATVSEKCCSESRQFTEASRPAHNAKAQWTSGAVGPRVDISRQEEKVDFDSDYIDSTSSNHTAESDMSHKRRSSVLSVLKKTTHCFSFGSK